MHRVSFQSYLDFHSELFPPVQAYQNPAQEARTWQNGEDAPPSLVTPQPGKTWGGASVSREAMKKDQAPSAIEVAKTQTAASSSGAMGMKAPSQTTASSPSVQAPQSSGSPSQAGSNAAPTRQMSDLKISEGKAPESVEASSAAPSAPDSSDTLPKPTQSDAARKTVSPPSSTMKTTAPPVASPSSSTTAATPTSTSKPTSYTHWSRSFLAGKTHLKPEYEDVHNISNTTSASVQLLKANMKYFFYPLSGPGGRLGYHPIEQKGRLPVKIPCITSGHDIVDFALDPFNEDRVFVAGSDGQVRVFEVKKTSEGEGQTKATVVLDGKLYSHLLRRGLY